MTPLIRTETATRRTPVVNYALIIASIFCFMLSSTVPALKTQLLALSSDEPALYQFFTYQFLYANVMHLLVNMFFLWVFGNSVNAKMGNLLYLVFYLTGGAFAGCGFVLGTSGTSWLAGAAGAVTLVTTAYLVLFARSRVTVFRFPTCPPHRPGRRSDRVGRHRHPVRAGWVFLRICRRAGAVVRARHPARSV